MRLTSASYAETVDQSGIWHRRTDYNHPAGNSYTRLFQRRMKEKYIWINEYPSFATLGSPTHYGLWNIILDHPDRRLYGRTWREFRSQFQANALTSY